MKIVIPEFIDILSQITLDELSELGDLEYYKDFPTDPEVIIKRSLGAEILCVKWIDFPPEIINKARNLKYIITLSSGFGHFPLKDARERGVDIINCPTHNAQAVAEHAIALMFAVSRKVVNAQLALREGKWKKTPYDFLGFELAGKKLGLVGYGNIGKKVEKIAKGLGMKVDHVNSSSTQSEVDNLLKNSDFISLNLPLNNNTRHFVDESRLSLLKKHSFLINTSRGAIVDQKCLYKFLMDKKIAGAGIDVYENTPAIGEAFPEIVELAKLENVVATPHIAFNTAEAGERLGRELIKNVKAILAGKPINVVN